MQVERYAAFTDGDRGGNPAGVLIAETLPDDASMQRLAAEVGYSETVFAAPDGEYWRTRYFAPEIEIPFCGHATIALGAALARRSGPGRFRLRINGGEIAVEGTPSSAALESLPTSVRGLEAGYLQECLDLFGFFDADLDAALPPRLINAGSNYVLLALHSRQTLADMSYEMPRGRELMSRAGLATIMLVHRENDALYHARNLFASGGVYEDPATGSAAAAFAGYLRTLGKQAGHWIEIRQGDDMGVPTRLFAETPDAPNRPVRVSGTVRALSV